MVIRLEAKIRLGEDSKFLEGYKSYTFIFSDYIKY